MLLDEIFNVIKNLTVAASGAVHLLADSCHVTKDCRVQKCCTVEHAYVTIDGRLTVTAGTA